MLITLPSDPTWNLQKQTCGCSLGRLQTSCTALLTQKIHPLDQCIYKNLHTIVKFTHRLITQAYTVALHTISEAVKLTGKSRKTIYNYMNTGRLSYSIESNGQRKIETSELIRVFGEISHSYTKLHTPESQENYTQAELITQLIEEVKRLRTENREQAQRQAEELAAIRQELASKPRLEHRLVSEKKVQPLREPVSEEKNEPKHSYSDIIKRLKQSRVASQDKAKNLESSDNN